MRICRHLLHKVMGHRRGLGHRPVIPHGRVLRRPGRQVRISSMSLADNRSHSLTPARAPARRVQVLNLRYKFIRPQSPP